MEKIENLRDSFKKSVRSLLNLDDVTFDEEASIASNSTVTKKLTGVIGTKSTNKSQQLMDEISKAIDDDEALDSDHGDESAPKEKSKSKNIKKDDYLKNASGLPSASNLLNNPLRDSFGGLQGLDKSDPNYASDLRNLTAKDIQRSFSGLDITEPSATKLKSKSKSKLTLTGSRNLGSRGALGSRQGSALSLINNTMGEANTLRGADKNVNTGSLGVTAQDLRRSMDTGLNNSLTGSKPKLKTKSKGSIADLINKPLTAEFGKDEPVAMKDVTLKKSATSLINGPDRYYVATAEEKKMAQRQPEESTRIDMGDPAAQPLMSVKTAY